MHKITEKASFYPDKLRVETPWRIPPKFAAFNLMVATVAVDFIAICVSLFVAWFLRIGVHDAALSMSYALALGLFLACYFALNFSENHYQEAGYLSAKSSIYKGLKSTVLSFGVLLVFAFLFKATAHFSRVWGVTWFTLFACYIVSSRLLLMNILQRLARKGYVCRRAIIVGTAKLVQSFTTQLDKNSQFETAIAGYLLVDGEVGKYEVVQDFPCLGKTCELEAVIKNYDVDDVVIAIPWKQEEDLRDILSLASRKAVNIYLAPDQAPPIGSYSQLHSLWGVPLIEIDRKPIDRWSAFLKRLEDLFIACFALAVLWPVLLLVAVAIKVESKGPVLFKQPRYGFNNELIDVLKFRSMYDNSSDLAASKLTQKNDPRVTRVGRFIRKTSIDELPQLFNVLRGNMSLVGPRPHAVQAKAADKLYQEVVDTYASRHRVKPGVTGWAQVNGWRGETDTEHKIKKRVESDMYYIRHWSIHLDCYILLKTLYVVLFEKDTAY